MVSIPRQRTGPKRSKHLPEVIERELRILVLDAVEDSRAPGGEVPQLIIGNPESGCHGTYFHGHDGIEFFFHHCQMKFATECKCIAKDTSGETYQIPDELDRYRIQLIRGRKVPFRLEPKLAAMVIMKIFLGMHVPEELRMEYGQTVGPSMDIIDEEGETAGSVGDKQDETSEEETGQGHENKDEDI
ncbi:hypothetical protein ONZ43_g5636 [Nemania bipapillata]|uniref:Uncharacterized protein n=1 Tax=Nemania bipapillata TaxID=110536 RepID=A0ACC2I890_9PEZI|nr:hypothetical protein ONZ43_g5636 [Nemania bipapillata]